MSLLRRREERAQEPTLGLFNAGRWPARSMVSGSGGTLDEALRNSASAACISVLARAIARTPFDAMRGTERMPEPQILAAPSLTVKRAVWRRQVGFSVVTDGNAFGLISETSSLQYPTRIEMLDPVTVTERRVIDGVPGVKFNGRRELLYPFGPIWHMPGQLTFAGSPFARSPLKYAAQTIGTSLCVEDFSQQYFTAGGPTKEIIVDQADPGGEIVERVKQGYANATSGSREPWVHGSGITSNSLTVDPNETKFIDLLRFEVEQACRFWLVPPSMVYAAVSGQNVTYSNVTQADLHYLKHSLDDYLVAFEDALTDCLPRPQTVKANRNAILRADVAARYAMYEIALRNKFMTVNEVRALEDLPRFDDPIYDQPGLPAGTSLADALTQAAAA